MLVRKAVNEDKAQIVKIWEYSFDSDSPEFNKHYFANVYRPENTWLLEDEAAQVDKKIRAALQLNPYTFLFKGKEIKTNYLVGMSALAEARGQGTFPLLLNEVFDDLYENNMPFIFLMAIDYGLYRTWGFAEILDKHLIKGQTRDLKAKNEKKYTFTEIDSLEDKEGLADLHDFYEEQVPKTYSSYIKRDQENFANVLSELWTENGHAFLIKEAESGQVLGSLFYYFDQETLVLKEMLYENVEILKAIFRFLYNHNTQKKFFELRDDFYKTSSLYLPDPRKNKIEIMPFLMARIINLRKFLELFDLQALLKETDSKSDFKILFLDEKIKANKLIWLVDQDKSEFISADVDTSLEADASQDWDFIFDISLFASLAFGWLSPEEALVKTDSLKIKDQKKFFEFAQLFFKKEKIFFNEYV